MKNFRMCFALLLVLFVMGGCVQDDFNEISTGDIEMVPQDTDGDNNPEFKPGSCKCTKKD